VLVVALGIGNVWMYALKRDADQRAEEQTLALQEREQQERTAAQRRSELIRLMARPSVQTTTLTGTDGNAKAYVLVDDGSVQVVSDGLPRNDVPRNVYVLWRVGDDNVPRALGAFDVGDTEIALHRAGELPADGTVVTRFAVSIEPGRRLPPKPTDLVASGKVGS
jgi:hypothetical protein